ncbi:hypothetical protein [Sphingobacterium siyangense]|uniref:hypothetical protein n=1 Tax=Sphingobacterium siyangense TaxID=459529 RepID=UPI0030180806
MIEHIQHSGYLLALIIRKDHNREGIEFFTKDEDSLQIGYMKRPKDYIILPHGHNEITRSILKTKEVLILKSGKIRVDLYDNNLSYIESRILYPGDIILLNEGGHGFKILEESEIVEVKQGPYAGMDDKIKFNPIDDSLINLKS